MSIVSFADQQLEDLYRTGTCRNHGPDLIDRILMALDRMNAVTRLQDLHFPRSLRLTKDVREPDRFRIHVKDSTWITFHWHHPHCMDVRLE